MNPNLLNQLYTLLWTFILPFAMIYFSIWAMWWPRRAIPYGRITGMSVVISCITMLYAAIGEDVFNWIQRL